MADIAASLRREATTISPSTARRRERAKFDGIFVFLRTNADLTLLEAMLCYKRLWMVERAFRTWKSLTLAPDRKGRAAVRAASAIRHRQGLTAFRCDPAAYPPGPLSWRYWHNGLPRPL